MIVGDQLKKWFDTYDLEGDHIWTKDEFKNAVMKITECSDEKIAEERADDLFGQVKHQDEGKITFRELFDWYINFI